MTEEEDAALHVNDLTLPSSKMRKKASSWHTFCCCHFLLGQGLEDKRCEQTLWTHGAKSQKMSVLEKPMAPGTFWEEEIGRKLGIHKPGRRARGEEGFLGGVCHREWGIGWALRLRKENLDSWGELDVCSCRWCELIMCVYVKSLVVLFPSKASSYGEVLFMCLGLNFIHCSTNIFSLNK